MADWSQRNQPGMPSNTNRAPMKVWDVIYTEFHAWISTQWDSSMEDGTKPLLLLTYINMNTLKRVGYSADSKQISHRLVSSG